MCQSKKQGGRRCTPHTVEALTAATDNLTEVTSRTDGSIAQQGAAITAALVRSRLTYRALDDRSREVSDELGDDAMSEPTARQKMLRRHASAITEAREPHAEAVQAAETRYLELAVVAGAGRTYDLATFSTGITARQALAQKLLAEHPEWSHPKARIPAEERAAQEAERIVHERAMAVAPLVTPANLEALSASLAEAGMAPAETAPVDRGAWLYRQTVAAESAVAQRGRRSAQLGSTFVIRPPHGNATVTLIRRASGWALCDYSPIYDSRAPIPGLHPAPKRSRASEDGKSFLDELFSL